MAGNVTRGRFRTLTAIATSLALLPNVFAAPQPLPAAVPAPAPTARPNLQPEASLPVEIPVANSLESRDGRNNANLNRNAAPAPDGFARPQPEPVPESFPEARPAPNAGPIELPSRQLLDGAGEAISPRDGYCNGAQYCAFSGAVYITGGGAYSNGGGTYTVYPDGTTPAQQAQCPAGYPQRCDSIGQSNYCCPSNNYCAYDTNNAVACCPNGASCQGAAGGYQPTSYYQPQQTTVYVAGGGGGYYTQPANTQPYYGNGIYCSTLVEVGPNLPTTAQGDCGTILIVAPAGALRLGEGMVRTIMVLGVAQFALGIVGFGVLRIW